MTGISKIVGIPILVTFLMQGTLATNFAGAAEVGKAGSELVLFRKAYRYTCQGDIRRLKEQSLNLSHILPQYYESEYYFTFGDIEESNRIETILAKTPPLSETASQSEKLNFVTALMFTRSNNVSLMENLINFRGESASYEANRLLLKSYIESLKGNWSSRHQLMVEVLEVTPILTVPMIDGVFALDGTIPSQRGLALKARAILEHRIEESINPNFTRAAIKYLDMGAQRYSTATYTLLEAAHNDCPGDQNLSNRYAYQLIWKKKYHEAHKLLESLIVGKKFASATAEALLAVAEERLGDSKGAKSNYLKTIDPNNVYASSEVKEFARQHLAKLSENQFLGNLSLILYLCIIPFGLLIILVFKKIRASQANQKK